MASIPFIDADFRVNSVNLSPYVTSVTLDYTADELDDTAMGDTHRSFIGGLKEFTLTVEFNQDFASSAVDQTLWPLFGTVTTWTLKATSAANAATNPQYSGSVLINQYPPFGNAVGEKATVSVTWRGTGNLARATS